MITLEDQLCPWKLSKQIVELGGNADSYFNWDYPLAGRMIDTHNYVIVEYYHTWSHNHYPAYTLEEILTVLPRDCIFRRAEEGWYCNLYLESYANTAYYKKPVEACAQAYIRVLKGAADK